MPSLDETIKRVVKNHPNFTFAKLVDGIMLAKGIKKTNLAAMIGYDRKTIYRIIYEEHIPEKLTTIQMGVALGLNCEQMELFLFKAGYVLCPTIKIDMYYLEIIQKTSGSGTIRLRECNNMLQDMGVSEKYLIGVSK